MSATCAPAGVYRPRDPRATPLYRLVEAHYDEVKGQWEERFEERCGYWRGCVDEHAAELLFRHKVMVLLQGEGLLSEERTRLLLSWRHTGLRRRFAACDPPLPAGGRRPPFPLSGPALSPTATSANSNPFTGPAIAKG